MSVILSNIYLDKLDKELEERGLRFTIYADDVLIFTKSEKAANRAYNTNYNALFAERIINPIYEVYKIVG